LIVPLDDQIRKEIELMNPSRAALKMVDDFLAVHADVTPEYEQALITVVRHELKQWSDWITAEDNGLTPEQIEMAHEFAWEGGASGRRTCDACPAAAEVHMLVTRGGNGETKEVFACKGHMLDPGPLLDW
jgi:hypothetical protein